MFLVLLIPNEIPGVINPPGFNCVSKDKAVWFERLGVILTLEVNTEAPLTPRVPLTSNTLVGVVEPIPTRPALISKNATVDPIPIFTSSWNVEIPETFRPPVTVTPYPVVSNFLTLL